MLLYSITVKQVVIALPIFEKKCHFCRPDFMKFFDGMGNDKGREMTTCFKVIK